VPVAEPPSDNQAAADAGTSGTSIPVTVGTDDNDSDEFLASNPTLSSSADNSGGSAKATAPETKAASDAVESLTKQPSPGKAQSAPEPADRTYVGEDSDESSALEHSKVIEPTAGAADSKPSLGELLAKEGETLDQAPPAVNSIISPDNSDKPAA
jgi:hypothetical protein